MGDKLQLASEVRMPPHQRGHRGVEQGNERFGVIDPEALETVIALEHF